MFRFDSADGVSVPTQDWCAAGVPEEAVIMQNRSLAIVALELLLLATATQLLRPAELLVWMAD